MSKQNADTPGNEPAGRRLELGATVSCSDGVFGVLRDVVIDPDRKRVTHLVAEPEHEPGQARLVPIELASSEGQASGVSLGCTLIEVQALPQVHEFAYLQRGQLPVQDADWDVGIRDVLMTPSYDAGVFTDYQPAIDPYVGMTYDRVPKGEVEIRRLSAVTSSDDHYVGRVEGFRVDGGEITHVIVRRGHFWRRRDLTIPIGAIGRVTSDQVAVQLAKKEITKLPTMPVRRPSGDSKKEPAP